MSEELITAADSRLLKLEAACKLIAEARTYEDVKAIRDAAQVMAYYVRERNMGRQAQNDAAEIKVRAEWKMGELLWDMPKNQGAKGIGPNEEALRSHRASAMPTYAELGITYSEASRCQAIFTIPMEQFEQKVRADRSAGREVTTAGLLKLAKQLNKPGKAERPPMADGCTIDDLHQFIAEGKRVPCVYADPPWQYDNQATRAATDNHYPTMPLEEIMALPVAQLTTENAHCHLWTTTGFLPDSFRLLEAWGFEYKSCFVWVKPQMGIGNYWRVSHEILLLGVKGSLSFEDKGLKSWAEIARGKHSAKPDAVRQMIERASPWPWLEMFAREERENWLSWGNEVKPLRHQPMFRTEPPQLRTQTTIFTLEERTQDSPVTDEPVPEPLEGDGDGQ